VIVASKAAVDTQRAMSFVQSPPRNSKKQKSLKRRREKKEKKEDKEKGKRKEKEQETGKGARCKSSIHFPLLSSRVDSLKIA